MVLQQVTKPNGPNVKVMSRKIAKMWTQTRAYFRTQSKTDFYTWVNLFDEKKWQNGKKKYNDYLQAFLRP